MPRARPAAQAKNRLGLALQLLGEGIVGGRWPVGSQLPPEPQLGELLEASRTVVREAVKSLVAKGLLVTGPKRGTHVLPAEQWNWFDPDVVAWQSRIGLPPAYVRDLQEIRRIVEPAAVRLAAQRATPADLAEIEAAYAGMAASVSHGGDYVPHDLRFHTGLWQASHNRMVAQMGQALGALLRTSFELSNQRAGAPAESLPRHRAVLDAVIAGDADAAERAVLVLIDGADQELDRVLSQPRRKLPSLARPAPPLKAPTGRAAGLTRTPAKTPANTAAKPPPKMARKPAPQAAPNTSPARTPRKPSVNRSTRKNP